MSKKRVATYAEAGVRPGEVRMIDGGYALILEPFEDGRIRACPVKKTGETGKVVEVGDTLLQAICVSWEWHAGYALPVFSAVVLPEQIGEKVGEVYEWQRVAVERASRSVFSANPDDALFDAVNPNSPEDWALYHRLAGKAMERIVAFEADMYVCGEDGEMRRETKRERRNRLARRRYRMKKGG